MDPKNVIKTFLSPDQPELDLKQLGFDPYDEVKRVKFHIMMKLPFFTPFIVSYPIAVCAPEHQVVSTAATDGNSIFVNALFFHLLKDSKSFNDRSASDEQIFVMCHEIMHIVFDSMGRRGSRDPQLWNVATDYLINATLIEFNIPMPKTEKFNQALKETMKHVEYDDEMKETLTRDFHINPENEYVGLYDERFKGMSAEEVYELLKKEDEEKEASGTPSDSKSLHRNSRTMDVHIIDNMDPEDQKEAARQAQATTLQAEKQMEQSGRGRGDLPAGLRRLIDDFKKPKVPWNSYIVAEIDSLRVSEYTTERVDPRFFSSGITLEGLEHEQSVKVCFMVDTSGSIGEEDLRKALGELYGICSQFDEYQIDVISCDTKVMSFHSYTTENGDEILEYPFTGGGGTLFEPAFQWMREQQLESNEHYDAVIYFTDGYGEGWCDSYQNEVKKMIWLVVNGWGGEPPKPSWGTSIYYDEYE